MKRFRAVSSMTETEFHDRFPNEQAAIDHFLSIRYKGKPACPHCKSEALVYRESKRLKVFHCSACNNSFSPFKGTIFERTHIGILMWLRIMRSFLNDRAGYSACHVARDTGVSYPTALRILHQLRKAMANRETEVLFEAVVEVDETYVGGKPRRGNVVLDENGNAVKNKKGRGTKKTPVVGVKERSTGRVYAQVMMPNKEGKKLSGKQLLEIIENTTKEGAVVNTDEFRSYRILGSKENREKFIHVTVNHSKKQYVAKDGTHTNGIENFWSVVKNGIRGVYHKVSVKYLQRYIDEFVFRQNTRLDKGMFDVLLSQCVLV